MPRSAGECESDCKKDRLVSDDVRTGKKKGPQTRALQLRQTFEELELNELTFTRDVVSVVSIDCAQN